MGLWDVGHTCDLSYKLDTINRLQPEDNLITKGGNKMSKMLKVYEKLNRYPFGNVVFSKAVSWKGQHFSEP
jgi:hypothetical protein